MEFESKLKGPFWVEISSNGWHTVLERKGSHSPKIVFFQNEKYENSSSKVFVSKHFRDQGKENVYMVHDHGEYKDSM